MSQLHSLPHSDLVFQAPGVTICLTEAERCGFGKLSLRLTPVRDQVSSQGLTPGSVAFTAFLPSAFHLGCSL